MEFTHCASENWNVTNSSGIYLNYHLMQARSFPKVYCRCAMSHASLVQYPNSSLNRPIDAS